MRVSQAPSSSPWLSSSPSLILWTPLLTPPFFFFFFFFSLGSLSWLPISYCCPRSTLHLRCCLMQERRLTHAWEPASFHHEEVSPFDSSPVEGGTLLHGWAEGMHPAGASGRYLHGLAAGTGRPLQDNPIETLEHPSPEVVLPTSSSFFLPSLGSWVSLYCFVLAGKPAGSLASRGPSTWRSPRRSWGGPGIVKSEPHHMTCPSRQCNQEGPCTPQAERPS